MALAAHVFQGWHARALRGTPAASDRPINVEELRSVLSRCSVVVSTITLEPTDLATLRQFAPSATVYCSWNAHAECKNNTGNAVMQDLYNRLHRWVYSAAIPEYKLGLEAYENVVQIVEETAQARGFDGVYWDELWLSMPNWVSAKWAAVMPPSTAVARWRRCRDHVLVWVSMPTIANVGAIHGVAKVFGPGSAAVSIEENHGTTKDIVRELTEMNEPHCIIFPVMDWTGKDPSSFLFAQQEGVEGLFLQGVGLPQ